MKVVSALQTVLYVSALALGASAEEGDVDQLQIGVKYKPDYCPIKSQNGDKMQMHYTGTLANGNKFDSSVDRNRPFEFVLGAGRVIKGWDQGLQEMCIGEKRKLRIPAKLGYGSRGSPPTIPGGATLIFDVELLDILNRKPLPHEVEAASSAAAAASAASSAAESETTSDSETVSETSAATESATETAATHESTTTESATTSSVVEAETTAETLTPAAEPTSSEEAATTTTSVTAEETHQKDEL